MILIADSGSSKTDWLFIDTNGKETSFETVGINPFFNATEEILEILKSAFRIIDRKRVKNIHFYGAGCIKHDTDLVVAKALSTYFTNAEIEVEDDMLGAAKALLGKEKGIACILGTGANSCLYDGKKIVDKVPTLGYVLGDEGSGAYLGKVFLNDYFKRAIPSDLKQKIDVELQLEWPKVLKAVYKGEYPSRYLASFSKFYAENRTHPYIESLVKDGFLAFLTKNVERYDSFDNFPVNFVGSIAYHYSDLLEQVATERGITIGKIIQKPIDGLRENLVSKM